MAAATRWGIISTGLIAFDFVNAISLLPPEDHQVVAVAARALEKAEKFAKEFNIPNAYGSYKELIDAPDINVVYIASINPHHFTISKQCIEAGKNVLCEKPMTMNADHARIILDLAKEKNVFFMEGIWSRFFPAFYKLREALASDSIGEIKFVNVCLGKFALHRARISDKEMGGSATLDLGCYPIQFAQMIFREYPNKIVSSGIQTETGIDEGTFSTLHYSRNRIAQVFCHVGISLTNKAEILGTKGSIEVPNFWCPTNIIINGVNYEYPLPKAPKVMNYKNSEGLSYEAEAVRQCLLKGEKEHSLMTHENSLWNMSIISEIFKQNNVVFEV